MAFPPDDFRCPISLEIMSDPVVLITGQTYDRTSIQRWLDAGHRTCPKSKQVLCDTKLIPNYALRGLIYHWAECNGVDLKRSAGTYAEPSYGIADKDCLVTFKSLLENLIKNLSAASGQTRRDAISEIKALAKESKERRTVIVEEGTIVRLLPLLSSGDSRTEEMAVETLLELSMDEENKVGLVAEGGVDAIVHALKRGSVETRLKAAATLTSLAMVDVNKATIGSRSDAIPGLVKLLAEGSLRGKRAAMNALCNLCMFPENKGQAVSAGVVPLLLALLTDGSIESLESSLALLDFLSMSVEGKQSICREPAMPTLVGLLKTGTTRSREHAAAVLWSLCDKNKKNILQAFNAGALEHCLELMQHGTVRARRKASFLAKAFQECGGES